MFYFFHNHADCTVLLSGCRTVADLRLYSFATQAALSVHTTGVAGARALYGGFPTKTRKCYPLFPSTSRFSPKCGYECSWEKLLFFFFFSIKVCACGGETPPTRSALSLPAHAPPRARPKLSPSSPPRKPSHPVSPTLRRTPSEPGPPA